MKIILTNWVNILGVFLATFFYAVILNLFSSILNYSIFQSMAAALILICGYGLMFWISFAASLVILDLWLIVNGQNNLWHKLLVECLLISSPFTYWAIRYGEWVFVIAAVTFYITQFGRAKLIRKVNK